MNFIPIEKIIVRPHRQRQEHNINAHQELVTSLSETAVGLQNALVLRPEGETYILLSGERRLRAIRDVYDLGGQIRYAGTPVPTGQVPCVLTTELSELAAEEAELEENIRRLDLTWIEKAEATARLARLRTAQAGEPVPVAAIAKEVRGSDEGFYHEATRQELIVAKHLDDPEVNSAKTLKDAMKVLKEKERKNQREELARTVGSTITLASHTCLQVDCREWVKTAPPGSFDVILTDPPYGMGADEFGDSGGKAAGAHGYEDSLEYWEDIMAATLPATFQLAKPNAHLYMFCDLERFFELRLRLAAAGWNVFRTPLVWHKPNGQRTPWVNKGPKRQYELILFAVKGDRPVNVLRGDVLTYAADDNLGHAAQKPVALYTDLLERSVMPGDKVLDMFCGTGTIFPAATAVKCFATGLELSAANYGIAIERLKGA